MTAYWRVDERTTGVAISGPVAEHGKVISGPISGPMAGKKSNSLPERMSWLNFRQTRKVAALKTMLGDIEKG